MVDVTLTFPEWHSAVHVGLLRLATSQARNLNHSSTYDRPLMLRLQEEVIGACGERAFCKAFGVHWDSSVDTFHHRPDAARNVEIRATARADGCLIVRDNDADERWFYLITGEPPVMTIRGSILGRHAKRPEWERNPHGHRRAWFVPQEALTPVRDLSEARQ